jgi:hypothetical protein
MAKLQANPSRGEIQTRCAAIRETWSERTHQMRAGGSAASATDWPQWSVPIISLASIAIPRGVDVTRIE